jgi:hypothetical protein
MQCCSGICLITPGAFMGAQLKIALRLISIFTLGLIGSAVQAREDVVTLVCPHPTYTETIVIDFRNSNVRSTIDLSAAAGHRSPVRAEITEHYIRFRTPNGESVDTINRLTGELVLGATGKRIRCQRVDKQPI